MNAELYPDIDIDDLVRMIVDHLARRNVGYDDGAYIILDLYQDAYADIQASACLH